MCKTCNSTFALLLALLQGCAGAPLSTDAAAADAGSDAFADAGDPTGDAACAPGLSPYKTACVPKFDTCKEGEVPLAGGGCKAVGVVRCDGGVRLPGVKACTPVGPQARCAAGFAAKKGEGCVPVLTTAKCPDFSLPILGDTWCRPVHACGTGTFGNIKTTSQTVFVNAAYQGSTSDGSQAAPYRTIQEALAAAPSGGHIAVAAGTYNEAFAVTSTVTIEGRCPEKVLVKGQNPASYAVIFIQAKGVKVSGLSVTGPTAGIYVYGGSAEASGVEVYGCGTYGLVAVDGQLTVRRSVSRQNKGAGANAEDGTLVLDQVWLRDNVSGLPGYRVGQGALAASDLGKGELRLDRCIVENNETAGLATSSAGLSVNRSVIRNNKPSSGTIKFGGMAFLTYPASATSPVLPVVFKDTYIAGNHIEGLHTEGTSLLVEGCTIADTRANTLKGDTYNDLGYGIFAKCDDQTGLCPTVTVRRSHLLRNVSAGLILHGGTGVVESSVVSRTKTTPATGNAGTGVVALWVDGKTPTALTVRDTLLLDNEGSGAYVAGGTAALSRVWLDHTGAAAGTAGVQSPGIRVGSSGGTAQKPAVTVEDTAVTGAWGAAVHAMDSSVGVARTHIHQNRDLGYGAVAATSDRTKRASLSLTHCRISRTASAGLFCLNADCAVKASMVDGTEAGPSSTGAGTGVMAVTTYQGLSHTLEVQDSLLAGNRQANLFSASTHVTVERSALLDPRTEAGGSYFGDNIEIQAHEHFYDACKLVVRDSLLRGARRGHLFVSRNHAEVRRSALLSGTYAAIVQYGGTIDLGPRVVMDKNGRNAVEVGDGSYPAPTPKLPK